MNSKVNLEPAANQAQEDRVRTENKVDSELKKKTRVRKEASSHTWLLVKERKDHYNRSGFTTIVDVEYCKNNRWKNKTFVNVCM